MFPIPTIYIWTGGSAILAFLGMLIAYKTVKPIDLKQHQPVLDATLNIVGTLVSILLGLLVAASLSNYQSLEASVDSEATSVADVCRLSYGLPTKERRLVLKTCLAYCDQITTDEWPAMRRGDTSEPVLASYLNLMKTIVAFKPKDNGETNIQNALITAMQNWGDFRRQRILWLNKGWDRNLMPVLIMCSLIVLLFAYLYIKRGSMILHSFLICFVATALGANLGLIYMLSHPFSSDWEIKPKGFEMNAQAIRKFSDID